MVLYLRREEVKNASSVGNKRERENIHDVRREVKAATECTSLSRPSTKRATDGSFAIVAREQL
jgi:hypothetical protein